MRFFSQIVILILVILPAIQVGASASKNCPETSFEQDLQAGRADLACCEKTTQCLFTSGCNEFGVCCYSPTKYASYKALTRMAQDGHCCTNQEDCESLLCIGGACWPKQNRSKDDSKHLQKVAMIVLSVSALLLVCCIMSVCCMRNLKVRVPRSGASSSNVLQKFPDDGNLQKEAAGEVDADGPTELQLAMTGRISREGTERTLRGFDTSAMKTRVDGRSDANTTIGRNSAAQRRSVRGSSPQPPRKTHARNQTIDAGSEHSFDEAGSSKAHRQIPGDQTPQKHLSLFSNAVTGQHSVQNRESANGHLTHVYKSGAAMGGVVDAVGYEDHNQQSRFKRHYSVAQIKNTGPKEYLSGMANGDPEWTADVTQNRRKTSYFAGQTKMHNAKRYVVDYPQAVHNPSDYPATSEGGAESNKLNIKDSFSRFN